MKQPQSKSCQDFPGRRYSGSGSTHQCGLRERHTNQMYRAVLSTLGEHCVLEEEFVFRRNKASNSADVGKDRHEHWHCSSLSARTNSTATLSFSLSAAFPLPFYCLTARFCRLSYLHRLPKQGPPSRQPPTSRHNLSTLCIVVCLTPSPSNPPAVRHPPSLSPLLPLPRSATFAPPPI